MRVGGAGHFELDRAVIGTEDPGVVDFGEIVIFGGQPEDRDGGDAVFGQPFRQADGMKRLVNGVSGSGKQAHLLAGHDRDRARLGQPVERGAGRVLHAERVDQGCAPVSRENRFRLQRLETRSGRGAECDRTGAVRSGWYSTSAMSRERPGSSVWRTQLQCMRGSAYQMLGRLGGIRHSFYLAYQLLV